MHPGRWAKRFFLASVICLGVFASPAAASFPIDYGCNAAPPSWTGERQILDQINAVRGFWSEAPVCWNNMLAQGAYDTSYARWWTGTYPPANWSTYDPYNLWCNHYCIRVLQPAPVSYTANDLVEQWHSPWPYYRAWVTCPYLSRIGLSYFVDPGGSGVVYLTWYVGAGSNNCTNYYP